MAFSSGTSKNLVIAATLLGAVGILAVRRLPRLIGEPLRFSDGSAVWSDVRAEGVRHAVWDRPAGLGDEINTAEHEARPALSPDGRWLVFAARGSASDWDLWIAALEDGQARSARPLAGLNSAADELAPAFGPEGLYLASNRPGGAGGFDLWVAPFEAGQVGQLRALPGALNTAFDELDPAPGRTAQGEPLLLFASDRSGNLDLFESWPLRESGAEVRAIDELNSASVEREPCLAADAESLLFARERGGSFNLARSFRGRDTWLAAQPLAGLAEDLGARAPGLSADGFTLYFEAPRRDLDGAAADPGDLFCAFSRELIPIAPPDLGWKDLLLVALLLATALLAWLAKRWNELDVLYKCFLLSVLVHLLAMWLLREVRPESAARPVPEDAGPTFRVQVLRDSSIAASQSELSGALEAARSEAQLLAQPQRLELETRTAPAEQVPSQAVEARASELAAAPQRREVASERAVQAGAQAVPELHAPAEQFERFAADSGPNEPAFAAALYPTQRTTTSQPAGQPERADLAVSDASRMQLQAPASAGVERPVAHETEAPGFASSAGSSSPAESSARAPALASLDESFAPLAVAERAEARPTARAFEVQPEISAGHAASGPAAPATAVASLGLSHGSQDAPASSPVARRADATPAAPTARNDQPAQRSSDSAAPKALALAAPQETFTPLAREEVGALAAAPQVDAQQFAPQRSTPGAAGPQPQRFEATPQPQASAFTPAPIEALAARPRAEDARLPEAPGPLFDTPYRTRFGSEKSTALREYGGGDDTEAAVARGLAYLASIQNRDGSWGNPRARHAKYRQVAIGKTGLALLAFLGAGHTPLGGDYRPVAEAAVGFLLGSQSGSSGHFGDADAYGHGIATYALAECFALTHEERLRAPLEAAVARILAAQVTDGAERLQGGWSYYYGDGAIYDEWPRASISSWQVMALESARLGGLEVPDAAFDGAREYLLRSWDPRLGAFRYSHDPERTGSNYATLPGSTPAAMFALALLGEDLNSAPYAAARSFVDERTPAGYRYRGDDAFVNRASGNLYFWYYGTLACFRMGGRPWERWNLALKETLLPSQDSDGSWQPLDIYARDYAGDDEQDRSYTTALCVLSLEVYYRYFTPLLRVR